VRAVGEALRGQRDPAGLELGELVHPGNSTRADRQRG
jgi:hypothetical protein